MKFRSLAAAALVLFAVLPAQAEKFTFSADAMSSTRAKGKERTYLRGHAKIVTGGMTITADSIELYGDEYRFALCTGAVVAIDEGKGLRLFTESLHYDRVEKLSRLEGFSTLEDKRNKLVIKGAYIENDEKSETAVIRIGVRVLKDDMACRAENARYDRARKVFELTGDPRVVWKGDEYAAETIVVDLETDDIVMKGSVSGTLTEGKDEEKKPAAGPESSAEDPADANQTDGGAGNGPGRETGESPE